MKTPRTWALLWSALVVLTLVSRAGAQAKRALLIRGATVLTVSGAPIPGGAVLVRDGRIAAVGKNLEVPPDAEIVEAAGQYLMPGIIDCHAHIAIAGSVNEGTRSVTSMVGTEDVIDPEDIDIYRDLAGGVTTSNILHGSANPIGGKNQVIKLRWGQDAAGLKFRQAPPGIKFALGENPKRSGATGGGRYPASRMGVADVIRDAFLRARRYEQEWKDYAAKSRAGVKAIPPRRDLELEPLVEVLQGKRLVHCHCYRADEILTMIRLAEEFGFRVATFQHVLEGYKVAREIATHGAGASTFSDWWAFKLEAYDAIPYNAAIMTRKGVGVSINSDSAEEARHLNQEAAKCVKYGGLTEIEALRLITLNPARQLGIDAWVGSLDVGKDADLVLYNHHPLSTRALPQKVWIDGRLYFDRDKELARQKEVEALKKQLRAEEAGKKSTGDSSAKASAPSTHSAAKGLREVTVQSLTTWHEPVSQGRAVRLAGVTALARPPSGNPDFLSYSPQPLGAPAPSQPPAEGGATGSPAPKLTGAFTALVNARVYPVSGPVLERGTVLIQGNRIAAVGTNVKVPAGAKVIDATGLRVYPGMIDGLTQLGLGEIGAVRESNDVSDLGSLNPQLRAYDAIHPASEHIPVTRVNGVTTVLSVPSGDLLGGQATLINLDGWTVEEMVVTKSAGHTGRVPSGRSGRRFEASDFSYRGGPGEDERRETDTRLKALTDLLDQARHYLTAKEATSSATVRHDAKLEALIPLLRGTVPLLWRANSRGEIRRAVEYADQQKLCLVILGGAEAAKVTSLLKEKDVPVIYGPLQRLPTHEDDPYDLPYATPAILARAGVRFAISAGDTSKTRNLPFEAGTAAGSGLSEAEALRSITLYPAQILGVGDRLGSLEPGKVANLVVTDGDLLEIRTPVRHVFINGRSISLESKHTRLWEKYRERP